MLIKIGDKVKKNPKTWKTNEFDYWGRGEGIGVVVEPPFPLDDEGVDVVWPNGRCFEDIKQLIKVEDADEQQNERSQDQTSEETSPQKEED